MGGIWERVIRTIKRVLSAICADHVFGDDVLLTLFVEAEHVVNSRPISPVIMDPKGSEPLTPNHLLILRSRGHSVGVFDRLDNCVRRRWRQVQYLSELF